MLPLCSLLLEVNALRPCLGMMLCGQHALQTLEACIDLWRCLTLRGVYGVVPLLGGGTPSLVHMHGVSQHTGCMHGAR